MRRPLLAALAVLLVASTLLAMAMDPPEGIRAFFVSYKTKLPRGEKFAPVLAVPLKEALDDEPRRFDLTKSDALLVPAGRDGGALPEGTSHLLAYRIKASKVCSDTGAACQSARDCGARARCARPKHTRRTGLVVKTAGTARIWGFDIDANPRRARRAIGVVPQELHIDAFFTPRETLDIQAGLYGVPRRERRTDEILAAMGLADQADAREP